MLRWLFTILCLLSLLLCVATAVLWFRSSQEADTATRLVQEQRYTAISAAGVLRLFGPPPPTADPAVRAKAEALVASLNNDQLCWRGWYAESKYPPEFDPPEPDPGTPA